MIQRTDRLRKLDYEVSENIAELYSSFELAEINAQVIEQYQIQKPRELVHAIGDTILGFYQTKDLPALLVQEVGVGADIANRIVADLSELLSPVLEREAALLNPKLGAMKELHQQFQKAGGDGTPAATAYGYASVPQAQQQVAIAPEQAAPQAETAPVPEPTHNVTPMRTMSADMNRIHGYGAYRQVNPQAGEDGVVRAAPQDELLKERPRLTGTPNLGG